MNIEIENMQNAAEAIAEAGTTMARLVTRLTAREIDERRRELRAIEIREAAPHALNGREMAYLNVAVANLGKKALERVVWPWEPRTQRVKVARGRVR